MHWFQVCAVVLLQTTGRKICRVKAVDTVVTLIKTVARPSLRHVAPACATPPHPPPLAPSRSTMTQVTLTFPRWIRQRFFSPLRRPPAPRALSTLPTLPALSVAPMMSAPTMMAPLPVAPRRPSAHASRAGAGAAGACAVSAIAPPLAPLALPAPIPTRAPCQKCPCAGWICCATPLWRQMEPTGAWSASGSRLRSTSRTSTVSSATLSSIMKALRERSFPATYVRRSSPGRTKWSSTSSRPTRERLAPDLAVLTVKETVGRGPPTMICRRQPYWSIRSGACQTRPTWMARLGASRSPEADAEKHKQNGEIQETKQNPPFFCPNL